MKKITFITILAVLALSGTARDRLYVEDFSIQPGETKDIPIMLENDTVYCSFQTDLYLPDGLEVALDEGEYWVDPTNRLSPNHFVSTYRQPDGALRIFVTSQLVRLFTGSSGPIVTVRIQASSDFGGRKAVSLRRSVAVEEYGERHALDDCTAYASTAAVSVPGDVNGDGNVDIADINAIINAMLGKGPEDGADVTGDSHLDIADLNFVINIVLGKGN